jgi:hypothetical protein
MRAYNAVNADKKNKYLVSSSCFLSNHPQDCCRKQAFPQGICLRIPQTSLLDAASGEMCLSQK